MTEGRQRQAFGMPKMPNTNMPNTAVFGFLNSLKQPRKGLVMR